MAISIKNYVDISTTFPAADFKSRAFGGLVFSPKEMLSQTDSIYIALKEKYESGADVDLRLSDVIQLFGATSDEYKFAEGYYSYISPSGKVPCTLKFAYIASDEKPIEAFKRINTFTNSFGSFTFLIPSNYGNSGESPSEDDGFKAVAAYNASDELDVKYLFVVNYLDTGSEADKSGALSDVEQYHGYAGTCYMFGSHPWSAYMPMAILASTDYQNGQVVNYMFKQFGGETANVVDQQTYTAFNQALINFYGKTQSNGQSMSFFQRGFNTDGNDTAIYCNELWFKSECESALLELLTNQERLPADSVGVSAVTLAVMEVAGTALNNGTFMAKEPSQKDIRTIREIILTTGGENGDVEGILASISSKGYAVYAYLSEVQDNTKLGKNSEKVIVYYVFYGTADSVRYIKGNDILLK